MKLRNKKTGEIIETMNIGSMNERGEVVHSYSSLAELTDEWEDYEEPKKYWFVADTGEIRYEPDVCDNADEFSKEIGNYFETREEAERAVKKLKAWKRLRDAGLNIYSHVQNGYTIQIEASLDHLYNASLKDLDIILFGGEE